MITILIIGFSLCANVLLVLAYLCAPHIPKKTPFAVSSCLGLSVCLFVIQWYHLQHLTELINPLEELTYRTCVFLAPAMFFYFGRALVMPDAPLGPTLLLHLAPFALSWLLPVSIALPILLLIGAGYAVWLSRIVLTLRKDYAQHRFELLFSFVVTVSAAIVLFLGSVPGLAESYFYPAYALSIGIAYGFVVLALAALPGFLNDLFEITQTRYRVSTLSGIDITASLEKLHRLMEQDGLYRDENLTLAILAAEMDITAHQLSELINTQLRASFSQFVRRQRVEAAKQLLRAHPEQSVLSVGLEVGFRSQSTFYAAFKEETQVAPGEFRRSTLQNDHSVSP